MSKARKGGPGESLLLATLPLARRPGRVLALGFASSPSPRPLAGRRLASAPLGACRSLLRPLTIQNSHFVY